MHRLPTKSSIRRFRATSLFLILKCLLLPVAVVMIVWGMIFKDENLSLLGIGFLAAVIFCAILQWIIGSRTRCPLCMTPVMISKACSKHRHAKSLLGDYQLRVATSVLFLNSFRCPYCNESTSIELRERRR
jgi:hypothetical protein